MSSCDWRPRLTWVAIPGPRGSTPCPTCAYSSRGAPTNTSRLWPSSAHRSRGMCGACRKSADSNPPLCPGVWPWSPGSTGPVIDGVVEHSPADYVRRPLVPAESLSPQPSLRAPAPGCGRAGFLDVERAARAAVESLEEVADVVDDPALFGSPRPMRTVPAPESAAALPRFAAPLTVRTVRGGSRGQRVRGDRGVNSVEGAEWA